MIETPLWNHLAPMYQYYDGGWAFEDGACPQGHPNNEFEWCECPRPWSDAWMQLGDALGDWDPLDKKLTEFYKGGWRLFR